MRVFLLLSLLATATAECPNACSGHGTCTLHDQCQCCRNWQGEDCSQRTCPFGLAFVDSPKGDLDGSTGTLSGPSSTLIIGSTVYPYGTQEQYPDAQPQEGHFYMECSNKGLCSRDNGMCYCFPGYEGTACQRASCPNDCSGHGTCETIKELAEDKEDGDLAEGALGGGYASYTAGIGDLSGIGNLKYELWDKTLTMGCKCDPGFTGPDCSLKLCRYGVDPLFIPSNYDYSADGVIEYDLDAPHFEKAFIEIVSKNQTMSGTFDLNIYDVYGEKYILDGLHYADYSEGYGTSPDGNGGLGNWTTCDEIMAYFPNDKIKDTTMGTVQNRMQHKGGLVSTAYVGGATNPFCTVTNVSSARPGPDTTKLDLINAFTSGGEYGIRYEFDYNRGNPGYIKDLYINNVIPEPSNNVLTYGFYGNIKQGEVAEFSDDTDSFDVTLPGYIYYAKNGSTELVFSKDVSFYLEANETTAGKTGLASASGDYTNAAASKSYKTDTIQILGETYRINATAATWIEQEAFVANPYTVGPNGPLANSKVYSLATNVTLDHPFGEHTKFFGVLGYDIIDGAPTKIPVKAKLTQVYQYVSECSNRGSCDRTTGLCQCYTGYTHDNCDTQTPVC